MEENKTHFKMYKAKKKWMIAGITLCGSVLLACGGRVNADSVAESSAMMRNDVFVSQRTTSVGSPSASQPAVSLNSSSAVSSSEVSSSPDKSVVDSSNSKSIESSSTKLLSSNSSSSEVSSSPANSSLSKSSGLSSSSANSSSVKSSEVSNSSAKLIVSSSSSKSIGSSSSSGSSSSVRSSEVSSSSPAKSIVSSSSSKSIGSNSSSTSLSSVKSSDVSSSSIKSLLKSSKVSSSPANSLSSVSSSEVNSSSVNSSSVRPSEVSSSSTKLASVKSSVVSSHSVGSLSQNSSLKISDVNAVQLPQTGQLNNKLQMLRSADNVMSMLNQQAIDPRSLRSLNFAVASNVAVPSKSWGVDVAAPYQNSNTSGYVRDGAHFVIVKLTQGTGYINPYAASQVSTAKNAGALVLGYSYVTFGGNSSAANAQAQYAIQEAERVGLPKGAYLAADYEVDASGSMSANTAAIETFMRDVQNAGYRPLLYSGASYMRSNINHDQIVHDFGNCLWVASYPTMEPCYNADFDYFPSMNGIIIWQPTDDWKGMNVDGDVNVLPLQGYTGSVPTTVPSTSTSSSNSSSSSSSTNYKSDYKVGDQVTINRNAAKWTDGLTIDHAVTDGHVYTVAQVAPGDGGAVLLKASDGETMGWVNDWDVSPVTNNSGIANEPTWTDNLGDVWHKETGIFTVGNTPINLRWGATTSSTIITQLQPGQQVQYDAWMNDGTYTWIRQPRADGSYAYCAVRDKSGAFGTFSDVPNNNTNNSKPNTSTNKPATTTPVNPDAYYTGQKQVNGKWQYWNNGQPVKNNYVWIPDEKKECYYDNDGNMVYGQQQIWGHWQYFDPTTGAQVKNNYVWLPQDNKEVYYDGNGNMVYGWQTINGNKQYFDPTTGAQAKNCTKVIDGQTWNFNNVGNATLVQPTTIQPSQSQPTTGSTTTTQPSQSQPTTGTATTTQPSQSQPTTGSTTTTQPSQSQPTTGSSTTSKPSQSQPTTGSSTTSKPSQSQPTTGSSTTSKPSQSQPTTGSSTTSKPSQSQPTTGSSTTTNPSQSQPTTGSTTTTQPSQSQPTTGSSTTTNPSQSQSTTGSSTTSKPSQSQSPSGHSVTPVINGTTATTGSINGVKSQLPTNSTTASPSNNSQPVTGSVTTEKSSDNQSTSGQSATSVINGTTTTTGSLTTSKNIQSSTDSTMSQLGHNYQSATILNGTTATTDSINQALNPLTTSALSSNQDMTNGHPQMNDVENSVDQTGTNRVSNQAAVSNSKTGQLMNVSKQISTNGHQVATNEENHLFVGHHQTQQATLMNTASKAVPHLAQTGESSAATLLLLGSLLELMGVAIVDKRK